MARPGIIIPEAMALPEHDLLARIFRALGDATRLRMLEYLIQRGSVSQSELVVELGATQSRLSEHASCLLWCGFIRMKRDGRRVHYELADPYSEQLIGLARAFLYDNPDAVGGCKPLEGDRGRPSARVYGVL